MPTATTLNVVGLFSLLAVQAVHGQSIDYRLSTLKYEGSYGGGEDGFTYSSEAEWTALLPSDEQSLELFESGGGYVLDDPNRPWSGAIGTRIGHAYAITGTVKEFSRIVSSSQTHVAAAAGGEGFAVTGVGADGNVLQLGFSIAEASDARLLGSISIDPDSFSTAWVSLEYFDGFTWITLYSSLFLPTQEGPFDHTRTLYPGQYRIVAHATGYAIAPSRPVQTSTWSYDLQIGDVPPECPSDINATGTVDGQDLGILLAGWGPCGTAACAADINGDDTVDGIDLGTLLAGWGACP